MNGECCVAARSLGVLDDVFYVYDVDGQLCYWNEAINVRFGLSDDELSTMGPADFFVPADKPRVRAAVEEVFETGATVVEANADTENGRVLYELTGRRLEDDDGTTIGFCGVGRDVTRVREREWQLERQNERLLEVADILAHDIRNPLQVAISHLEIELMNGESDSLSTVEASLDRIRRIVEDVLAFAREGQVVTNSEPVELAAVVDDAWDSVETEDAILVVESETTVEADPVRLQRLFENVFRNSVEHGGADVTVTVADTDFGFEIFDDGPGIPDQIRTDVFEIGLSNVADGTGIGLSIVRNLAAAHGWTVEATDSDDGARFVFEFDSYRESSAGPRVNRLEEDDERGE
ncbi:MAG: sensor histidine kinase [Halorientalis sp.]